jgi:glycosyltransferase involved in cell wall biosynthesis
LKLLAITSYYKPAYIYGGPVRSESALYENLASMGVEVTVITTNANGRSKLDVPLLTPINLNGVKTIYCPTKPLPGSPFFSPAQLREAKQLIPSSDIVNLQTFWGYATLGLSVSCVEHDVPYYVSLRGQLMEYAMKNTGKIKRFKKMLFLKLIGYKYLNGASALHCTSPLEMFHLKAYPIKTKPFLVPNIINVYDYSVLPVRGKFREKFLIPDNALVMVLIGRLDPVKNPNIAVSALIAAQELPSAVHLIIVGPDPCNLRPSLIEQANNAGCESNLHFTGLLDKDALLQIISDSDLLIMPSKSENFGMSAAECMAAGLPILVSNKVPVGTMAKEAFAGEIAPCDEFAFSKGAVSMLKNPKHLKEMGNNGKIAAQNLFDSTIVARKMLAHIEKIVKPANE